jgi:precorrin-6B methylase 2
MENRIHDNQSNVVSKGLVILKTGKAFILYLMEKLDILPVYSLAKSGPLFEDGWFRSVREKSSVDATGDPIPWFTYPAIDFLKKRVHRDMSIFEFGCGYGTIWWANRVKEVISVEHVNNWHDKIAEKIPKNVKLFHIQLEPNGDYSKKIKEFENQFDIVVIDGRDRVNCAINSIHALKKDGVFIWDNSDRKEYTTGYRFLYEQGFSKIEFVGFVPIYNIKSETGIFYRKANCLGI